MFKSIESSLTGWANMYPSAIVLGTRCVGPRWVLSDFNHSFDVSRGVVTGRYYSHGCLGIVSGEDRCLSRSGKGG
jgi:hypothetical protein